MKQRCIDKLILAAAVLPALVLAQAPAASAAVDSGSPPVPFGTVALAMLALTGLRAYNLRQASQRSLLLKTGMESFTSSSATHSK